MTRHERKQEDLREKTGNEADEKKREERNERQQREEMKGNERTAAH